MTREPFDSSDPAEVLSDNFRREVVGLAARLLRDRGARELSSVDQLQAFMAGVTTGLIGVCFAHIEDAGRDTMMKAIVEYLPLTREQAEAIIHDAWRKRLS